jgi:two-component system OmpR family response regulator
MANILVIDDEPVLLDLISNTLRLGGHQVTAVSNPVEACELFQAGGPTDLVVTGVSMKPISGFEIVARLNAKGFTGSVLFTSAGSALSSAIVRSMGERAIIEKPFTAAQLRSAVRKSLTKVVKSSTRKVNLSSGHM